MQIPIPQYQAIIDENRRLQIEGVQLRSELDNLRIQAARLALPVDTIKRLQTSEELIQQLRKENSDLLSRENAIIEENQILKLENEKLKQQVAELENQVKSLKAKVDDQQSIIQKLNASYEIENKLAIRELFVLARKLPEEQLPKSVWEYIKITKKPLNVAAHRFSKERILSAIEDEKKQKYKNMLKLIFETVFADDILSEDEVDDENIPDITSEIDHRARK